MSRTVAVVALVAVALLGAGRLLDALPSFLNPFATRTVDRSEPAVLHALADVSEYRAATANYSIVVDVEKDARWLPSFVKGERTTFVAAGSVDATVDLGGLDASAVSVHGDSVTIALPHATLSDAVVDPERSHVASRDRGVVDRVAGVFSDSPTSDRPLFLMAQQKLDAAARADDSIVARAERNTTSMLRHLLAPLGFEHVTVVYGDDAGGSPSRL